ncbi:MAG: hypothetical protein WCK10_03495, partial [Candidatus Staskawiczbacteria bacterium]
MIEINNLTNVLLSNTVDKKSFSQVAKKVLLGENRITETISLALVNKEEIKKLNKEFRKKNKFIQNEVEARIYLKKIWKQEITDNTYRNITKEYVDNVYRHFRLTGLIAQRGYSNFDFSKEAIEEIKLIKSNYKIQNR